ncbi:uncharacterized protein LOC109714922 isoform X2 [Ananas comosus]|uniref:Uncharacterized protein LOC109714922 isoform X2 n=1 Tax=Ananas comosus TaxID=4615 RepID=A0A6P5FP66_ANACO|nr:uncharacterized protein LOC109714922 isoform X2 [Ananas comosus]
MDLVHARSQNEASSPSPPPPPLPTLYYGGCGARATCGCEHVGVPGGGEGDVARYGRQRVVGGGHHGRRMLRLRGAPLRRHRLPLLLLHHLLMLLQSTANLDDAKVASSANLSVMGYVILDLICHVFWTRIINLLSTSISFSLQC